eukprot:7205362-Ditylum_brightwellii.AAC.1
MAAPCKEGTLCLPRNPCVALDMTTLTVVLIWFMDCKFGHSHLCQYACKLFEQCYYFHMPSNHEGSEVSALKHAA